MLSHRKTPALLTVSEPNACRTTRIPAPQVLLLALKLVGIGFWSLTISKIIKSVTTLSNPASVAYAQVRLSHARMHSKLLSSHRISLPPTHAVVMASSPPPCRTHAIDRERDGHAHF